MIWSVITGINVYSCLPLKQYVIKCTRVCVCVCGIGVCDLMQIDLMGLPTVIVIEQLM